MRHANWEEDGPPSRPDFKKMLTTLNKNSEGDFSIMGAGTFSSEPTEWVSTGLDLLDLIIHGGLPVGKFVTIYGKEASGKSLLLMSIVKEAQKANYWTVLVDTEKAYSRDFAHRLGGIDMDKLIYLGSRKGAQGTDRSLSLEEALDAVSNVIETIRKQDTTNPILIGIDSIAGLATRTELDGLLIKDNAMAAAARKWSIWFRKMVDIVADQRVLVVMTNQQRERIGTMPGQDNEAMYGGGGPRFYSSVILRTKYIGQIKEKTTDKEACGSWMEVTVRKNRLDPPGRKAVFPIYFSRGLDNTESLVEVLRFHGLMGPTQGWFCWGDKKFRKKEFLSYLAENPEELQRVREQAMSLFKRAEDANEAAKTIDPSVIMGADDSDDEVE